MAGLDLEYKKRPSALAFAMLALALLCAAIAIVEYRDAQAQLDAASMAVSASPEPAGGKRRKANGPQDEARDANAVIDRLTLPWQGLFAAFEMAGSGDVALIAIEPDAVKRTIRVTAEARNARAMIRYVERLQAAGGLREVTLARHEIQTDDASLPVRFVLTAAWEGLK